MGNTNTIAWNFAKLKDHPHIHGEYGAMCRACIQLLGSPPHTWGIRIPKGEPGPQGRITPTYMGNTLLARGLACATGDHPHIHGEY